MLNYLCSLFDIGHFYWLDNRKQVFDKTRCGDRRIFLLHIVLMGIGIVTDPSHDDTGEVIHQSSCLHFNALGA
jgi:hypothetical protein